MILSCCSRLGNICGYNLLGEICLCHVQANLKSQKKKKVEKFAALNLRLTFKVVNLVMNEILGPHAHGTSQQRCVKPYACDDVEKLSRSSLGSV